MTEKDRVDFVAKRDGKEAAMKFAQQTLDLYIKAAIDSSKYKESIDELQDIIKKNRMDGLAELTRMSQDVGGYE